MHYPRLLKPSVEAACKDTPVVLINGARQTGKTTLAKEIYASHDNGNYFTLDDPTTLVAAKSRLTKSEKLLSYPFYILSDLFNSASIHPRVYFFTAHQAQVKP